jgi:hypothetical protein
VATFKNITEYELDIPAFGAHVAPGESFDVPDDDADTLRLQTNFAEVKTASKSAKADTTTAPADAAATSTPADSSATTVGA